MRSLSSSMSFRLSGSAIGLRVGESGGAAAQRQRPQQRRLQRRAQGVALQQEDQQRGCGCVQQDVTPVFRHRCYAPLDVANALHGGSLRVASSAGGFGDGRSWTFAAAPGLLASASASTGSFGVPAVFLSSPPFFSVVRPPAGAENCRSICGPGFGGLPEAKPSSSLPKLSLVRSSKVSLQISTIGALTQAPRHSTSSQLKSPSAER